MLFYGGLRKKLCDIEKQEYLKKKINLSIPWQLLKHDCGMNLLLFSHWVVSHSFESPFTVAHQAPLSTVFSVQEY